MSMEARRGFGPHSSSHRHSLSSNAADRQGLIRAYDEEEAAGFGLTDLAEDSDESDERSRARPNGTANGHQRKAQGDSIEMQPPKSS